MAEVIDVLIKSRVNEPLEATVENIEKAISENIKRDSFAVAYMDYRVLIGRYINGKFNFYKENFQPEYLRKLRVFNKDEELLFWRSGDGFKGRMRIDGEGKDCTVVEVHQVLFGTEVKERYDGFVKIGEERGTELILPFNDIRVDNKQNRVRIKTRNYIDFYEETEQATYADCRFVSFTDGKNDLA